jgi:hypothetical protein
MTPDTEVLSTADLAAAAQPSKAQRAAGPGPAMSAMPAVSTSGAAALATATDNAPLAPLFQPQEAKDFRANWDAVQSGFVDDPQQAVRKADELVAQVMKTLAESFASERAKLETHVDKTDHASTENLRVALRRYRSFFQRLLAL